jgi:competence ComEA-like helix-hairpin-helix protein
MYQHDVNQKQLSQTLDIVVESAVNHVGVDVNTASAPLLSYVAGVSGRVAKTIVKYREEYGPFRHREEIKLVKGLGDKIYQQAIGFLKIPDGMASVRWITPLSTPKAIQWWSDSLHTWTCAAMKKTCPIALKPCTNKKI